MTDKELQKLSRAELLSMLVQCSRENDELKEKVASLEETVQKAKQALDDRRLNVQKAGNFADASVKINGVFEAAEKAARQYMENVRRLCEEKQAAMEKKEAETREYCARLIKETERKCAEMADTAGLSGGMSRSAAKSGLSGQKQKADLLNDSAFDDFSF